MKFTYKLDSFKKYSRIFKLLALAGMAVGILTGFTSCSSGSDSENATNVNQGGNSGGAGLTYSGPAPLTEDVQAFRENIWNNIGGENRCGECHKQGGQGSVPFVRDDDINAAYQAALTLVDLDVPINSALVQRVGTGHGCWDSSPAVCADLVEGWIQNWASASTIAATVVTIQPVALVDPGASLNFPSDTNDFETLIYDPILRPNCGRCHSENGIEAQQQPFFASLDLDTAYNAARARIDLNTPANSRFVRRMNPELHNCWDPLATGATNCMDSAAAMQTAIQAFVDGLGGPDAVDTTALMVSKALSFPATPDQGQSANASGRFESNMIAKYEFKNLDAFDDTRVVDTSGVDPALDLTMSGDVDWVASWGLNFFGPNGKAQGLTGNSQKLYDMISLTGQYAIETWVIPGNVTQEARRIISYSGGGTERNFTLGQTMYNYDFLNRTDSPDVDANGTPEYSTPDADEFLQASLQHVVVNFDPINGRSIYVNGELATATNAADIQIGSSVSNWNNNFVFVLGNESANPNEDFDWKGTLRFVAVYNSTIEPEHIQANFEVGVGQKYYMPFSIEHLTNISGAYIVFEVERFDDVSYLFNEPFFTIAGSNVDPESVVFEDFTISNMRIGVNGREAASGQAYAKVELTITDEDYRAAENNWLRFSDRSNPNLGMPVAGTLMLAERDADDVETDEFFLSFDSIAGNNSSVDRSPPNPPRVALPTLNYEQSDIGLKHFYEINEMYSAITGVPKDNIIVAASFNQLRTQLPSTEDALAFGTSNQMGIAQFAAAYCEAAVDDNRASLWPALSDGQPANAQIDEILQPLLQRIAAHDVQGVAGAHLTTQADPDVITGHISTLLNNFGSAGTTSGTANVEASTIAVCAAVLASASTTVQ